MWATAGQEAVERRAHLCCTSLGLAKEDERCLTQQCLQGCADSHLHRVVAGSKGGGWNENNNIHKYAVASRFVVCLLYRNQTRGDTNTVGEAAVANLDACLAHSGTTNWPIEVTPPIPVCVTFGRQHASVCCCAAAAVCKSKVAGQYLSGQQCLRLSRLAESERLARPARYCRSAVAMTTMGHKVVMCVCVCVQIEGGPFRTLVVCVFVCQATQVVPSLLMLQVAHCWCFAGRAYAGHWQPT